MPINRREFLRTSGIVSSACALARPGIARSEDAAEPKWRTYQVTTQIEVLQPTGVTRVWAPVALPHDTPFQKTMRNSVSQDAGTARVVKNDDGVEMVVAEFQPGVKPVLIVVSEVATRDWSADLDAPGKRQSTSRAELSASLKATKMLPTDGIVKERAQQITKGAGTDLEKARAIYEWIVENTHRDPKVKGCGLGNIRFMLESGDLGGKCADLNALYVGLARASGLPARDVYGIRIAPSVKGCKSLGTSSPNITKAQHCRAEVFLEEYGWVPVDPADVRKVVLEEPPGNHSLQEDLVKQVRQRLFGSWEMNWMAYNYAQDVVLPGASGPPVHFLMYPQGETSEGRLDSLDPDHFHYQIEAHAL